MANQRLNATITIGAAISASLGRAVGDARRALGSIGAGSGGLAGMQTRLGAAIERNNAAMNQARWGMVDAVGSVYALKMALGAPLQAAADFETMLEDIGQKADIPVERLGALGERIQAVARETNQSATTIGAAVDALVGRGAGIDVALAAADPIGKAATAYRASTDDLAAASWAAVDNLKIPADQIESALDAMAQAGKAGAFELRDMATYFPALGAAYQGLGQDGVDAVADLAAALQVVRKGTGDSSTAATNLQNVLQKIYSPGTVKKFAEAGVDVFAEMETAAQRGLTPIEAIAELTEKTLGGDLSKMGNLFEDAQVQAGLRAIIQNLDEYRRIRSEAMGAQGVLDADYARRIKTAAGAQARWAASVENLSITFGQALLPALNGALDAVTPIIGAIGEWVQANPGLTAGIVKATVALVAFRATAATLRFAGLVGKGGALQLMALGMDTVGRAGVRLGGAARGAIALQTALGAMSGGQALSGLAKFGIGLRAAVMAVPGVSMLGSAITAIGAGLATISAPVWGTFAAIAAVVAAAGVAIWKYWDRISSVFGGVASRIGEELAPAFEVIRPVLDWFAPMGDIIAAGWAAAGEKIGAFFDWVAGFFTREVLTEEQKAAWEQSGYDAADRLITGIKSIPGKLMELAQPLLEAGKAMVQSLWDGMVAKFDELVVWVQTIPGRIIDAIGRIDLSNVISWPKMPSWLGGGEAEGVSSDPMGSVADTPVTGRAIGGYYRPGPVLVGEKGPELRFENRAGYIATARRSAELMGGGAGSVSVGDIHIHAQPGQSSRQIADEVLRMLQSRSRGALYDGAM